MALSNKYNKSWIGYRIIPWNPFYWDCGWHGNPAHHYFGWDGCNLLAITFTKTIEIVGIGCCHIFECPGPRVSRWLVCCQERELYQERRDRDIAYWCTRLCLGVSQAWVSTPWIYVKESQLGLVIHSFSVQDVGDGNSNWLERLLLNHVLVELIVGGHLLPN